VRYVRSHLWERHSIYYKGTIFFDDETSVGDANLSITMNESKNTLCNFMEALLW
jgi:hypothetical protein